MEPDRLKLARSLWAAGKSYTEIGAELGVSRQAAHKMLKEKPARLCCVCSAAIERGKYCEDHKPNRPTGRGRGRPRADASDNSEPETHVKIRPEVRAAAIRYIERVHPDCKPNAYVGSLTREALAAFLDDREA